MKYYYYSELVGSYQEKNLFTQLNCYYGAFVASHSYTSVILIITFQLAIDNGKNS
jgi:hypothetical protein